MIADGGACGRWSLLQESHSFALNRRVERAATDDQDMKRVAVTLFPELSSEHFIFDGSCGHGLNAIAGFVLAERAQTVR